jgi:hypothetical protein
MLGTSASRLQRIDLEEERAAWSSKMPRARSCPLTAIFDERMSLYPDAHVPSLPEIDGWFATRGYGFVLSKDGSEYWAALFSRSSFEIFAPKYGKGPAPLDAAVSARERYITEEGVEA